MRTFDYTVSAEGADKGKSFVITRMDAFTADKWARHAVQSAIRGGARIGATLADSGMAGLASVGLEIFGFMDEADLDRAFDKLIACVKIRTDPANPNMTRAVIASDFEEPDTLGLVRGRRLIAMWVFCWPPRANFPRSWRRYSQRKTP